MPNQVEQVKQAAPSDSKRVPSAPRQPPDTQPLQYRKVLAVCPTCGYQNKLGRADCPGCVEDCPDGFTRPTNLVCGWDQARRSTAAIDQLTFRLGYVKTCPREYRVLGRLRPEVFSTGRRVQLLVTVGVDQAIAERFISVVDGVFLRGNSHQNTSPPIACRVTTWSRMEQKVLGTAIAVGRNILIDKRSRRVLAVCIENSRCSSANGADFRPSLRGEQQR